MWVDVFRHRTKLFLSVQLDNSESLWPRTAIAESLTSIFAKIEVNLFVPITVTVFAPRHHDFVRCPSVAFKIWGMSSI